MGVCAQGPLYVCWGGRQVGIVDGASNMEGKPAGPVRGASWLTAAIPMDNPYRSCKLNAFFDYSPHCGH